jgi:hypothetical protein
MEMVDWRRPTVEIDSWCRSGTLCFAVTDAGYLARVPPNIEFSDTRFHAEHRNDAREKQRKPNAVGKKQTCNSQDLTQTSTAHED